MARRKSDFKNTWQYKRILEILDDYWLSQPEEEYVDVKMYFRHKNGEEQKKHIIWSAVPTTKGKLCYTWSELYAEKKSKD